MLVTCSSVLTTLVTLLIPEAAKALYPAAVVRAALATAHFLLR
jgi:hypothetical protein